MSSPAMTRLEVEALGGLREPYREPRMAGLVDANGVEWWACDPYPTWYRWEDGKLITGRPAGRTR